MALNGCQWLAKNNQGYLQLVDGKPYGLTKMSSQCG